MPNGASIDTYESFTHSALPHRVQDDIVVTCYAGTRKASRNKTFPVSARGWFGIVEEFRRIDNAPEAGIYSELIDPFYDTKVYLPFMEFLPNCFGGRAEDNFMEALTEKFGHKKLYIFENHGFLATLMDRMTSGYMRGMLVSHPTIINFKSLESDDRIRTHPYPRLTRWVNL